MNCAPIFVNTRILILSFLPLRYCPYFCKHWNSDRYPFQHCHVTPIFGSTLVHLNSALIFVNIRILSLSFLTLEFCPYFIKHWNTAPIFVNIGSLILSFVTLEFWLDFCKRWSSDPILPNTEILALFY